MAKLKEKYDVVIVGTGVAGLNCALNLPADKSVLIICKKSPRESDSYLAQGGICRLRGEYDYEEYYNDTMRAGHYENNPAAVERMINGSREIIDDLIACGVDFARQADGGRAGTLPQESVTTRIARAAKLPPCLCATWKARKTCALLRR